MLIETPTDVIHEGQASLIFVFVGTAFLLLVILFVLSKAIWVSYLKMTKELAEKDANLQQISNRVSHDLRSPLVALQMLQPNLAGQPENIRNMFSRTVNRIHDIANELMQPKDQKFRNTGRRRT
jgi:light-regulated signal transduction histidine kinase (bacteriophytochrome)